MNSSTSPAIERRSRPFLGAILLSAALFATSLLFGKTVTPDPGAIQTFVTELDRDYRKRQSQALVDRLDGSSFMQRLYCASQPIDISYSTDWKKFVAPMLAHRLAVLDEFQILAAERSILANDTRILECQFLTLDGLPALVEFTLVQTPEGEVRIADFELAGEGLPTSRLVRQWLLLSHVALPNVLDPEDAELKSYGSSCGATLLAMTAARNGPDPDRVYRLWTSLPDEVKQKRVWRNMRDTLALTGSKAAYRDLEHDLQSGVEVDPFTRFRAALMTDNREGAIAALDAILIAHQEPVFYRCMKANLLVAVGRPMESYEIYRDICDLMPRMRLAYLGGIEAATAAHRPDLAVAMLQRWTLAASHADIETEVGADPKLADFHGSAEYQGWFNPKPATPLSKGQASG